MTDTEMLTLEEAAHFAGQARWLETRLFEVLGSWVAVEPDASAKVLWSTHSLRHAAFAEVWRDRQPRVAHLDCEALTNAAGPGVAALLTAMADLAHPDNPADPVVTISRLVAVARVIGPRRLDTYRNRCRRAHPLADRPTLRWAGFVLADAEACRAEAEALLAPRLAGPGIELEAVDAVEAEMTALLAGEDNLIGLTDHARL